MHTQKSDIVHETCEAIYSNLEDAYFNKSSNKIVCDV